MTVVTTPLGQIAGAITLTRRAEVEAFLGIPFASSPAGEGRFRAPGAPTGWSGVLDAKHSAPAVPQNPDPVMIAGGFWQPPTDEARCLNLNVWTPASDGRRRPVMMWTHGGAYVGGSNAGGMNGGAELAAALDVVVVSPNYRLGALGFLALDHLLGPEFADSSSVAVLDQLAALEWIRHNIACFGGDPDDITVFGESAGGAMVGTLLGSPLSAGLFRRAIVQSGTAERARPAAESYAVTAEFFEALGIPENEAERLLELDITQILAAQAAVVDHHARRTIGLALPFQPSIGTRALPEHPLDAIRGGINAHVDLLAGTNLNEASFFTALRPLAEGESADAHARTILESDVGRGVYDDYVSELAHELGHQPHADEIFESALTDRLYRQPTNRLLDARLEGASGRTFSYLFTWASPMMGGRLGACHALEVPFVFRQLHRLESATLVGDNPPKELSEWMSGAWVEFARRGAPQAPALPDWPEYTRQGRATMVLDRRPGVEFDPRGALRTLWNREVRV